MASSGQKEEGYDFIKKGVRMDMGSHIVWHVYGLMNRADKNFEEALKCYSQANKIEKVPSGRARLAPPRTTRSHLVFLLRRRAP